MVNTYFGRYVLFLYLDRNDNLYASVQVVL